jgi:hypothetical protein
MATSGTKFLLGAPVVVGQIEAKMAELCNGKVKISKKLMQELGRDTLEDSCMAWAKYNCPNCHKLFCKHHLNKHKCSGQNE